MDVQLFNFHSAGASPRIRSVSRLRSLAKLGVTTRRLLSTGHGTVVVALRLILPAASPTNAVLVLAYIVPRIVLIRPIGHRA